MEKGRWKWILGLIGIIPVATLVALPALYADQRPSVSVDLDRDVPSSPTLGGNFQVPVIVKNEGKTTAERFHWFVLQQRSVQPRSRRTGTGSERSSHRMGQQ
jgi:hypothetical protein